jgi:hypothetical protein
MSRWEAWQEWVSMTRAVTSREGRQKFREASARARADTMDRLGFKEHRAITDAMEPGEQAKAVVLGKLGSALVATDRRIFIYKAGITTGHPFSSQVNTFDYLNISGVTVKQTITTLSVVIQVPGLTPVTDFRLGGRGQQSAWEAPNALLCGDNGSRFRANLDRTVTVIRGLIADHQKQS